MKNVKTEIIMEATAKLKKLVEEELEIEDPDLEVAEAILKKSTEEDDVV